VRARAKAAESNRRRAARSRARRYSAGGGTAAHRAHPTSEYP